MSDYMKHFNEYSDLIQWTCDERLKPNSNRIKASKIYRIAQRLKYRYEEYYKQAIKHRDRIYG